MRRGDHKFMAALAKTYLTKTYSPSYFFVRIRLNVSGVIPK